MAPAGTPQAVIARITQELQSISKVRRARAAEGDFVQIDFADRGVAKRIERRRALTRDHPCRTSNEP